MMYLLGRRNTQNCTIGYLIVSILSSSALIVIVSSSPGSMGQRAAASGYFEVDGTRRRKVDDSSSSSISRGVDTSSYSSRPSMLTQAVNSVFAFFRVAEFEILFVLFFLIAFLIFKDLTSRPEYNQILVKKPGATDWWP